MHLGEYLCTVTEESDSLLHDFQEWFLLVKNKGLDNTQLKLYNLLFTNLEKYENAELADEIFSSFQNECIKYEVQKLCETSFSIDSLAELADKAKKMSTRDKIEWIPNELARIEQETDRSHGLQWRLECLNRGVGSIIKGDLIIVAASVGTGKTTFATSEASYMCTQISDGDVLWLNNEEANERVQRRFWQALLGKTFDTILEHAPKAKESYIKKLHGNQERFKLIDIHGKDLQYIAKVFKTFNPKLVIIDQVDNIHIKGKKFFADYERLGHLYTEIRALAKQYCPVIAISQTSNTAYVDKKEDTVKYQHYIDQTQLRGSTVDKAATADFIITIGKDLEYPNIRYINIPKEKAPGLYESERNLKAEVVFNGDISRYEDL